MATIEEVIARKELAAHDADIALMRAEADVVQFRAAINYLQNINEQLGYMEFEDILALESQAARIFSQYTMDRPARVEIIVEGGVARVGSMTMGIQVEIRDLDNENHG